MMGKETIPTAGVIQGERSPTSQEIALWNKAETMKRRAVLYGYMVRLQYSNLIRIAKFAKSNDISINEPDLPALEVRMLSALKAIEALRLDHCDVNGLKLGVSPSANGNDLDIVKPPTLSFGAIWIPIAIGVVIVGGIIARWAHLETEVGKISEKYNGVLRRADANLCSDPNSALCKDWEETKLSGGYAKNETLIDSVKNAVTKVGSFAAKGLGAGLLIAIPVLLMMYLPRRKEK